MLRSYRNVPTVYSLCKLFIDQIVKRYQSAAKVASESKPSNTSIFSGHIKGDITNKLEFIRPEKHTPIPMYQVLDTEGNINDEKHTPDVSKLVQINLI